MLLALHEVGQDLLALCIAYLLKDDLLGGLCADTAKIYGFQRLFDEFADLDISIELLRFFQLDMQIGSFEGLVIHHFPATERFEFASITIDLDAHVGFVRKLFFGRGSQSRLQRFKYDLLVHVLLARQSIHQQ